MGAYLQANRPLAALLLLLQWTLAAQAADFAWNTGTGNWSGAGNWTPGGGPPGAADNATINIAGTYTVTLNDSRAITNLSIDNSTATLSHTANTFTVGGTITLTSGSYSLNGGTISGGAISSGGGLLKLQNNSNNQLNNVSVGMGVLDFSALAARVRLQGTTALEAGTTLNLTSNVNILAFEQSVTTNALTVNLSGGNARVSAEGGQTLILDPSSTVTASGSNSTLITSNVFGGAAATVHNQGLIRNTGTNTLTIDPATFANLSGGVVRATSGTIAINSDGVINQPGGTFDVNGGTLSLAGTNWINQGTINVSNGTLSLAGSFTTAGLGSLTRTGGTIRLTGALDNSSATLALTAASGSFQLDGGTITGGSVTASGGSALLLQNNPNNRLINVSVGVGVLDFSAASARVRLQGTTALAAGTTVNLGSNASILAFEQSVTTNALTVNLSGANARLSAEGGQTLILDPASTVTASGSNAPLITSNIFGGAAATVHNQGLIRNTGTGTLTIDPVSFANLSGGIVRATSGTLAIPVGGVINQAGGTFDVNGGTLNLTGSNWANQGMISLSSGTLALGGSYTTAGLGTINRTGGTIRVTGALDNSSATLALTAASGSFQLDGGTITGGSITATGGSALLLQNNGNNRLNNVSVALGVLDFSAASARVRLQGTTTLAAGTTLNLGSTSSILAFEQTVSTGALTVNLSGSNARLSAEGGHTLTLGPTTTVTASGANPTVITSNVFGGAAATVHNQGLIRNMGTNTLTIDPATFASLSGGVVRATSGTINIPNATNLTNYAGNTLTGGTWEIEGTATLNFNTRPIASLAAGTMVLFNGTNPTFAALDSLTTNNGTLRVLGGKTLTPTAASVSNAGTIEVGATSTFGKAITVTNGGTLQGAGTVSGTVTLDAGAMLSTGASVGTLTVNNDVTFNGGTGSTWVIEINGTGPSNADRLALTGTGSDLNFVLSSSNKLTISLLDINNSLATEVNPVTYTIATKPADGNFLINGLSFSTQYASNASNFVYSANFEHLNNFTLAVLGDELRLTFNPSPEPSAVLVICAGGLAAAGLVRRRFLRRLSPSEIPPPAPELEN